MAAADDHRGALESFRAVWQHRRWRWLLGSEVVDHRVEPNAPTNSGQAIFVMRPDLFRDQADYRASVDAHLRELRTSQTRPGAEIRMPGARAAALEEELRADGVPVPDALLGQLQALAAALSLDDRLD